MNNVNLGQKEAILTTEGPVLIIAGPGTGKTFTLVKRIVHLIKEKGVKPEEILIGTFTEKAAKELITRVSNELLKLGITINMNEMYIGTFHSICLRIMKENEDKMSCSESPKLLDSFQQVYTVYQNMELFKSIKNFEKIMPSKMGTWKQSLEIVKYVSVLIEEIVDLDLMERDFDKDIQFLAKLTKTYINLLDKHNLIDFASIQKRTYDLLINNEDVLKEISSKIKYIMIDEYQDTNYIQEQIVFLLGGDKQNICVVGDDDQGMYRFRGATIRNILEFPNKFKDKICKEVYLDTNYRSEKRIIDFYNEWMKNTDGINLFNWDKYRFNKNIVPGKKDYKKETSVISCGGYSNEEWKKNVVLLIRKLQEEGKITNLNQIAFLFRSVKGSEAKELADYLEENNIPVYSPRSEMFFERKEIKQILGCILFVFTNYISDLKNNTFANPIHEKLQDYYRNCLKEAKTLIVEDKNLHSLISHKQKAILNEGNTSILNVFYELMGVSDFEKYLKANIKDGIYHTREVRNLAKISEIIVEFNYLHNLEKIDNINGYHMVCQFFNTYIKCLYIDGIGETEDESEYAPSGCVSFFTFHQSKGLEYPVVIVNSLKNSPRKDVNPLLYNVESRFFKRGAYEPLENIKYFDFWRMYYTAFSRAQNLLVLSCVNEGGNNSPSKYFENYFNKLEKVKNMDFSSFEFELVKDINLKNTYSFTSHISLYNNCPTKYKFVKEFGFIANKTKAATVGSLVHNSLEEINKLAMKNKVHEINKENIENIFQKNYKNNFESKNLILNKDELNSALKQVKNYCKNKFSQWQNIFKSEEEVQIVSDKYVLKGIIDLIQIDGDNLEIVDFKTNGKPDIEKNPHWIKDYKRQLEVYAYLVEKTYNKKVSKMTLYYTNEENPFITFERDENSMKNTINFIEETITNIEGKNFDSKSNKNYVCSNCHMKYFCKK